jgi:hypothetical protein
MIEIEINPPDVEAQYLESLNTCFGQWGDQAAFDWYFRRRAGGPAADLIVLRDGGRPVAGSAVVYRQVRAARGETVLAGIMSGSWTLPEARGQGCFSTMIHESVALAGQRGGALLLAYVTERNASFRRLSAAGAALFPTYYCVSGASTPPPQARLGISHVEDVPAARESIYTLLEESRQGYTHFDYSLAEWTSQFVDRPADTEIVTLEGAAWCVLERAGDTDRVLVLVMNDGVSLGDCLATLVRRSIDRGRNLFLFCTEPAWHAECTRLGLTIIPGYLTALGAGDPLPPRGPAVAGSVPETDLVPPAGPSLPEPPGRWSIQSGDRM